MRLFGDLAVAAFFAEAKPRRRESRRGEFAQAVVNGQANRYLGWIDDQRHGDPPLAPFHWEIEFPEVFERENPGFDAFVGNPPFAGKNNVAAANVGQYPDWLKTQHKGSHGNSDLVAHFYRRAFDLSRDGGAFGLIATNTIAQGDTRSTGLRWICQNGGEIYRATKRVKWPGDAAVVVSVLYVIKGTFYGSKVVDGKDVGNITAFLFHAGGHTDPVRLEANAGQSFQGSIVLGMGFTFDDTDRTAVSTPVAEMHRLIETDPHNREAIFPYIGGEEVNTNPAHVYHRYVINFWDYPLCRTDMDERWVDADEARRNGWLRSGIVPLDYPAPVASDWPQLLAIVREKAKPERDDQNRKALRERWWQYAEKRPGLYAAIAGMTRVLVTNCGATPHLALAFAPANMVFANTLVVFPFDTYAAFCALQSRPHEIWARFFGSSMKDDLRYTPSDCFETFPFADRWEARQVFEAVGREYYEYRAALMMDRNEGMTKTYNRFHDPYEDDPEIVRLRDLHAAMDRAVLDAYGWTDIPIDSDFLLDYEIDEATWGTKKKPYRYRWPDEVSDEVLVRLLALNVQRAAEEARERLEDAAQGISTKDARRSRYRRMTVSDPALKVAETELPWDPPDVSPTRKS